MRREKNFHVFFFSLIELTTPAFLKKTEKTCNFAQIERKISILALNDRQIILYILNKNHLMRREQKMFACFFH